MLVKSVSEMGTSNTVCSHDIIFFYLSLDYNDYAEIPDGLTSPEGILTLHSGILGLMWK